jgi:hypothetical protein
MSGNPLQITLRFCCRLPVNIALGGVSWRISLEYYGKGAGKAEIIANSSNGRRGTFIDGRAEVVERALRFGVCVPMGTVRYRLALALAAIGKAELEFGSDETR